MRNVVSYSSPSFSFIAPLPADAVPLIAKTRQQLQALCVRERRKRKTNDFADDLVGAIRAAYLELTGTVGLTVDAYKDGDEGVRGGLIDLGRDVDWKFKVKIAGRLRSRRRKS